MATVFGKKVDTPILKYEEICITGGGSWTINSSVKLLMAGELDTAKPKWLLLALDPRGKPLEGKLLRDVIENIEQYGNNLNMNIPTIDMEQKSMDELASVTKKEMIFYQLVFVIMPDKFTPEDPYPEIKQIFELNLNILTQCLKRSTLETTLDVNREKYIQKKDQYFTNLLLKINAKLNGKNHALNKPLCDKKVMVMGADVTHPAPGSTNSPSIAAVTASHENDLFNYNMQWRVQSPKQEIIQEMEKMTQAHLEYYHKKNKSYPERIIFYRDGVGDGQLAAVMNKELLAIQKACSNISTEIQITYLVVQKRNHTRFFSEKNGNVIPGFMVNSKITHPWHRDFYLVSQLCPRGTARPARYRLLHDDASMTDNDVQNMTYALCMLYSKCAKSISYPTPTYYAHLAAARAKVYFFAIMQDMPTVDFTGLSNRRDKRAPSTGF
ncbi:protein argonaute-2-like isoform X2 [Cloeon dipterum]|uniref:protein argonaute-2-like isoform X2 n=1 Tax=Cloeon dipterum TaxID=197152 RepID=UPI00321FD880